MILNSHRSAKANKLENLKKHLKIEFCTNVHSDSKTKEGCKWDGGGSEEEAKGNTSAIG